MPKFAFISMRAFKKFPELIPLVGILATTVTMSSSYAIYSLYFKSDVRLVKSSELPPYERVDPTKRQKLITINQKYMEIPELEALRKEIGSYKS